MEATMVRDGQQVAPFCPACGCRLGPDEYDNRWEHFGINWFEKKDAKGCECPMLDRAFAPFSDGWYHINHTQTLHWVKLV